MSPLARKNEERRQSHRNGGVQQATPPAQDFAVQEIPCHVGDLIDNLGDKRDEPRVPTTHGTAQDRHGDQIKRQSYQRVQRRVRQPN